MAKKDSKGRKVKCKNCEKEVYKSECYIYEYLDKNLNIKNRYYCDKECCDNKELEKELVEKSYKLFNEMLEMPVKMNMYFNMSYKPIKEFYDIKVIHEFLVSEREYLLNVLNKDFVSNNSKIKYFFMVMQDKINKYKDIIDSRNNREIKVDRYSPEEILIKMLTHTRDFSRELVRKIVSI